MKISIRVFDMLDRIAKGHHLSDVGWAEASEIRRPTIPELRRVSRAISTACYDPGIKRACTLEKVLKLSAGLRIKVGNAIVNAALKNYLDTESNQDIRLQILILILQDANKEKKDAAEAMLKSVLHSLE